MGLRIKGWRQVGLGLCKVGGVESRSNRVPSAQRMKGVVPAGKRSRVLQYN